MKERAGGPGSGIARPRKKDGHKALQRRWRPILNATCKCSASNSQRRRTDEDRLTLESKGAGSGIGAGTLRAKEGRTPNNNIYA